MRIRIFCVAVSVSLCLFYTASSYSSFLDVNSAFNISAPVSARSKPTFNYIKLASVQFLVGHEKKLTYSCPADGGWVFDTEAGCVPQSCDYFPYVAGSPELAMCAIGADGNPKVKSCLSGNVQLFKCDGCKSPLVPDGLGGCMCNRSEYKVEKEEGCPENKDFIEKNDFCTEISNSGEEAIYYKGCDCPEDWVECTGALVGEGEKCRPLVGNDRYKSCKCNESYVSCDGIYQYHPDNALSCREGNITKYSECYTCRPDEGYIGNLDHYWCGYDWMPLSKISETYVSQKNN